MLKKSNTQLVFLLLVAFVLISCSKEESYTIQGRFLNGTTNVPYQNVKIDFTKIIGPDGFTKTTSLGTVNTDDNGEFSFNYTIGANENGKLQLVFGYNGITDMLTKSGIELAQNNSMNFYLSDSCRTIISFQSANPLKNGELLKIYPYNEAFDTLYFSSIELANSNFNYTLRTKKMFRALGVERVSTDSTISIFNPTFDMEGDPVINNLKINY